MNFVLVGNLLFFILTFIVLSKIIVKSNLINFKKIILFLGLTISVVYLSSINVKDSLDRYNDNIQKVEEKIKENSNLKEVDLTSQQEFSKKVALESLTTFLKKLKEGKSIEEKLELISSNQDLETYIDKEVINYLYLTDYLENDNDVKKSTLQTLLFLLQTLENNGNSDIEPILLDYDSIIYLDKNTKIAQVPVNIYTGTIGSISFELVYINNQWKLAPYTLLESVALSAQIQEIKE